MFLFKYVISIQFTKSLSKKHLSVLILEVSFKLVEKLTDYTKENSDISISQFIENKNKNVTNTVTNIKFILNVKRTYSA